MTFWTGMDVTCNLTARWRHTTAILVQILDVCKMYILNVIASCPQGIFVRWLKVNFSQVFIAWIHLKALRVFAESVLRSALMRCTFIFSFNLLETFNLNHFTMSTLMMMSPVRYGLPVNYQALLLHTDKKRSKKLREDLASLFKHLDPTASNSKTDVRGQIQLHKPSSFKLVPSAIM